MEGYEVHALRGSREQRRVLREEEIEAIVAEMRERREEHRIHRRALQHFRADSERTSLDNQAWARSASRRQAQELAMQAHLHEEVAASQQQLAREEALVLHTCSERRSEEAAFDNLRSYALQEHTQLQSRLAHIEASTHALQCKTPKLRIALHEAEEQIAQQASLAQCCARSSEELQAETYRLRQMALDDDIKRKNMLELFADQAKQMAAHTRFHRITEEARETEHALEMMAFERRRALMRRDARLEKKRIDEAPQCDWIPANLGLGWAWGPVQQGVKSTLHDLTWISGGDLSTRWWGKI